ncbi:SLAIN motif-containing protein-like [Eucyclogobius newberryi]|uniref:SLAIN motif-containing protein-like n=1 Tax=Eucyclogobius newberryi TaxID=166745 RepID=UPI003B5CBEE8
MELQNQLNVDQYFCNNEYDTKDGNNILVDDFKLSSLRMDGNSNPDCGSWVPSYSGSYTMDARIRLETLKSGSSSPVPTCTMNESMYSYDFSKDIWEIGRNELTALDSVDLIDVEGEEEDEESWLYVSPKEFTVREKTESTLRWCRQVLDNRSPEIEAACLKLINRLNLKLSGESRQPDLQQTGTFSLNLLMDQTSYYSNHDRPLDSNYKLLNITDVYDIARIQEACLRQENVYTPRGPESSWTLPHCSNTTATNTYNSSHGSCRASVPGNQPARIITEKNCPNPKVTRLHQYKMLKRAQNEGSSSRSSSPMRTSLRSLQAVRSSRSLDVDDHCLDLILHPKQPSMSSERTGSSYRSSSHSAHHKKSNEPVQSAAIRKCQRSHSLSPCRIPLPAMSSEDRVFSPPKNLGCANWLRSGRQLH